MRATVRAALLAAMLVGCGGEDEPDTTEGTYTLEFPSAGAAVATDYVQLLVFGVKKPADRTELCPSLIARRASDPASLVPDVNPPEPALNICEMRVGRKPVTVPYGEHAILAVGQRRAAGDRREDFVVGCSVMTIGRGNAPKPIAVALVKPEQPLPPTACTTLVDFCERRCQ